MSLWLQTQKSTNWMWFLSYYNSRTLKPEAGGLRVQEQFQLHCEFSTILDYKTLSQNRIKCLMLMLEHLVSCNCIYTVGWEVICFFHSGTTDVIV